MEVEAPPDRDSDISFQQIFTTSLGHLGLINILPYQWSQLTTLFTRGSKICGHKSNYTTTMLIIKLLPRVLWCQVHIWTPLCLNMAFVMDNLLQAQKFKHHSGSDQRSHLSQLGPSRSHMLRDTCSMLRDSSPSRDPKQGGYSRLWTHPVRTYSQRWRGKP